MLKGRSNYLCKHKLSTLKKKAVSIQQGSLIVAAEEKGGDLGDDLAGIEEWASETPDGDSAGLPFELPSAKWDQVSVSGRECPGASNCSFGAGCFAERAKERAHVADVVVVNTALYCLDALSPAPILPPHAVVVFDEAHRVEENAISATGKRVTGGRFAAAARMVRAAGAKGEVVNNLEKASAAMRGTLGQWVDKPITPLPEDLITVAAVCRNWVEGAYGALVEPDEADKTDVLMAKRSLRALSEDIGAVLSPNKKDAAWVEMDGKTPAWRTAAVDIAPLLKECLWGRVRGVLTSATIPGNLPAALGLPEGRFDWIEVESPFDYDQAGVLYCARHLPHPKEPEWKAQAHALISRLVSAAGGRTLGLFTSIKAMEQAAEVVRGATGLTIYVQEGSPNPGLLRRFAEEEESSLFATMGMWQGVDVPGRSLSLVVIDRIPFARPDDPVANARKKLHGPELEGFFQVSVPDATVKLAQGAGRLIRSGTDRGVVAVLDSRLAKKGYGKQMRDALPPFPRSTDIAKVESFLASIRQAAEAA